MNKRQVRKYTEEFRESSAKLAVESDKAVTKIAQELGISATTLHDWIKRYYPNLKAKKEHLSAQGSQEELKKLKKELQRVKQERDILKKAAAYFASEIQ